MQTVHAFGDDALGELDAVGVVQALHRGDVSVPEIVEAAISRVNTVQPHINALAFTAYDRARTEALAPRGGYFSGVPTFIKDNVDVAGMPTSAGTDAWVASSEARDGDFATMMLATGVVVLGKSQLSEYGFSASCEHPRLGAVRTPWNTAHTAGASSSGSGALVAAGAVPFAHANDGGGSIRIPAAVNGLVGLKPTRDRLATEAYMRNQPVRVVADGVLTRSVRDTAAFFRESEKIYRELSLPPIGDITRPGRGRLNIAFSTAGAGGLDASPEVAELTRTVAGQLEDLGHSVAEVPVPVSAQFRDDFILYWGMLALFTVRTGRRQHGRTFDRSRHDNLTLGLARHATKNLHRLPAAIRRLKCAHLGAEEMHEKFDVVLTPTLATQTPKVGELDPTQDYETIMDRLSEWVAFTPWHNVTGNPAISLPLARTAAGLPHGMMFAAGSGQEATLLELAYELEQAHPFELLSTAHSTGSEAIS